MSASQTPHYGLNQWSPEDQFLREEFNADNAKTDAALAALASSVGEKAAQADLTSLTAAVNGKANQSDLTALTQTVKGKAAQSALDSLTQTVNTKAAQTALDSLTATVNKKANQADLTSLTTTVNKKANQSDLTALTQTVNTKAAQSALNSLTATVNTKASQADLNAVSAANKWVKLCEVTSGADAAAFNVALPAQDYSKYSQLRFMFYCTATVNILYNRLNGVADATYFCGRGGSFNIDRRSDYLFLTSAREAGDFGGEITLLPYQRGEATSGFLNIAAVSGGWLICNPAIGVAVVPFRNLRTLNFYVQSGVIKAGAWCAAYGLLK